MNIKYQIFVSSTFRDLEQERRITFEQILNLGHIPVGMELFQAGNESQWAHIQKRILECDYYLVVVAERYGSVGEGGQSYTHMEYDFAVASGVPVAAFLLHEDARKAWPREYVEFEQQSRLDAFRTVCEGKLVRYWKTADDLGAKVTTALVSLFNNQPRTGWVRADSVAPASALVELSKLSEEKRSLQSAVSRLEQEAGSKDSEELLADVNELLSVSAIEVLDIKNQGLMPGWSALDLFMEVHEDLALGLLATDVSYHLRGALGLKKEVKLQSLPLLKKLATLNLIVVETHTGHDSFGGPKVISRYYLTEYGKRIAKYGRRKLVFADVQAEEASALPADKL